VGPAVFVFLSPPAPQHREEMKRKRRKFVVSLFHLWGFFSGEELLVVVDGGVSVCIIPLATTAPSRIG
jgi:hypothetical protein